jgi:CheY-like chemotaxis protein
VSFDQKIGMRLREKRKQMGMTLEVLSKRMGISLPQMQKYESGATKLSPRFMYELCKIFSLQPNYFFESLEPERKEADWTQGVISQKRSVPLRILIVDDNPSDTCLTQAALQESSKDIITYEIRNAEDVLPALNRRNFPTAFGFPDIILLDLQMRKMNGLELLKRLKKDRVLSYIPIIVLSSALNRQEMHQAYENFASGYICKPFSLEEYKDKLLKTVDYWVDAVVLPYVN